MASEIPGPERWVLVGGPDPEGCFRFAPDPEPSGRGDGWYLGILRPDGRFFAFCREGDAYSTYMTRLGHDVPGFVESHSD